MHLTAWGLRFLGRRFRRLTRTCKSAALILLYHRVAGLPLDSFRLAVSPTHFGERQDVVVKGHTDPSPFDVLASFVS